MRVEVYEVPEGSLRRAAVRELYLPDAGAVVRIGASGGGAVKVQLLTPQEAHSRYAVPPAPAPTAAAAASSLLALLRPSPPRLVALNEVGAAQAEPLLTAVRAERVAQAAAQAAAAAARALLRAHVCA